MHRVPELEPRAQLQVARLEHALQQQDGAAPVQRAQPLGLGQVQQREAICRPQAGVGALDAVAVGIGLDDGPDTGIGRLRAGTAEVVMRPPGQRTQTAVAGSGVAVRTRRLSMPFEENWNVSLNWPGATFSMLRRSLEPSKPVFRVVA